MAKDDRGIEMGKDGVALLFKGDNSITIVAPSIDDEEYAPTHMLIATAIVMLIEEADEDFQKIINKKVLELVDVKYK